MRGARAFAVLLLSGALVAGCEQTSPATLSEAPEPERITPRGQESWLNLGLRLLNASDPAQAEIAFQRSLLVEGVSARALTGAGIAAAGQGHMAKAEAYLTRARLIAPQDVDVNNALGLVLYSRGNYSAAQEAFQTAFVVSSGSSDVAKLNLDRSESILFDRGLLGGGRDEAMTFDVVRLGRSEYRLTDEGGAPPAQPDEATAEDPTGDETGEEAADDAAQTAAEEAGTDDLAALEAGDPQPDADTAPPAESDEATEAVRAPALEEPESATHSEPDDSAAETPETDPTESAADAPLGDEETDTATPAATEPATGAPDDGIADSAADRSTPEAVEARADTENAIQPTGDPADR
ncbi:MAG: tetratricopeptide repeat protein [Pseudomonadota bacterium]